MIEQLYKIKKDFTINIPFLILAFILLFLVELLVIKIKLGLFILLAVVLFLIVLLKPVFIYFLLVSLFSIEGFTILPGASYPKLLGILLLIGLMMRIAITKEWIPEDSSYKYFLLFFLGGLVSFAFAKNLSVSVTSYITYISLFCLYVLTRYFLKDTEHIKKALNYLFFSTLILFAIVQTIGLSVRGDYSLRVSGGIGDPNEFASYLLVLMPLSLYMAMSSSGVWRFSYWICLVSFLVLTVLTASRGGVLGFLGIMAVVIYYYSKERLKQLFFLILILLAIAYFNIPENFWFRVSMITNPEIESSVGESSIKIRLENYQAALKMFLDFPFAGVGLNNFQLNCRNYGASKEIVVHNTYLEILTGGGLITFIPFSIILVNCWRKLKVNKTYNRNIRDLFICLKASFVSILITSFFISGDHKKILWFLLALISSAYYIASNQKRSYKSEAL
jgi:O-antigen ligase